MNDYYSKLLKNNLPALGKNLPIILFTTVLIFKEWFYKQNFVLNNFNNVTQGIATNNLIDIGKRVSLFYESILLILLLFIGLLFIWKFILDKIQSKYFAKAINYLSSIGLLLVLFELLTARQLASIQFILTLIVSYTLYTFLVNKRLLLKEYQSFNFQFWLISLSLSLSFIVREFILVALSDTLDSGFHYLFLGIYSLILFALILIKPRFPALVFNSAPLFCIPILSVLSDEIYLIFNQRAIDLFSPNIVYLFGLLIILLIIGFRIWKNKEVSSAYIVRTIRIRIPLLLIASIILFSFYTPFVRETGEMFELANPSNAIMRLFKYNEWPIAEALSSHLLSEQIFGILYVILNGYSSTVDFFSYYFLIKVVAGISILYFIIRTFNSRTFTYAIILFYPFLDNLFIIKYFPIFITILLANKLLQKQSLKTIMVFCFWNILILFWSPDVGVANGIPALVILFYSFIKSSEKRKFIINISFTSTIVLTLIGIIIVLCRQANIDLGNNLKQALDYFGANQAHGIVSLGSIDKKYIVNYYFIIPFAILSILLVSLINYKKYNSKTNRLAYLSLIMLAIYYFANFQRGLVRHGVIQGYDTMTNSFAFLIISLFGYLLLKKHPTWRIPGFILISILLIHSIKYPFPKGELTLFEKFSKVYYQSSRVVKSDSKINRVTNHELIENKSGDIIAFLDSNLSNRQTFLDFSNSPMLYFYTQKSVPSYFNQSLQNIVTDYLQEENIYKLEKMDIPIVVFSHYPTNFWDALDGIPNTIRHYHLAQYIFEYYVPYKTINSYYIWIRKDLRSNFSDATEIEPLINEANYNLGYSPWVMAQSKSNTNNNTASIRLEKHEENTWIISDSSFNRNNKSILISLRNNIKEPTQITLIAQDSVERNMFNFKAKKSNLDEHYLIAISAQYNWMLFKPDSLIINAPKGVEIKEIRLIESNE